MSKGLQLQHCESSEDNHAPGCPRALAARQPRGVQPSSLRCFAPTHFSTQEAEKRLDTLPSYTEEDTTASGTQVGPPPRGGASWHGCINRHLK